MKEEAEEDRESVTEVGGTITGDPKLWATHSTTIGEPIITFAD
jgi:hypothetical protein